MKFRIRICRHGDSPHEGNDATRGLSDLGREQITATARQHFPRNVEPILVLTSRKARAQESMVVLLQETGNGNLVKDMIPLHGMDYSWPMKDAKTEDLVLGPEHDNVTTVSKIQGMFPYLVPGIRAMLMGSLMTAIQMKCLSGTIDPDTVPEVWITSHSPFGELMTPDPDNTTRRRNGGGITFILELPEDGVAVTHSLEQF